MYADRTYVFPGDGRADVTRHYRAAAEREGWKPSPATRKSAKEDQPASLCFTLGKKDDSTTLDVYFLTEAILEAEESETGPEFDSGAGYRVCPQRHGRWFRDQLLGLRPLLPRGGSG